MRKTSLPQLFFYHHARNRLAARKISESPMGKSPEGKEGVNKARDAICKEGYDFSAKKRFSDQIMPRILRLYAACATPSDFEIYSSDASFEDPLMSAQGVQQIKSAFYSLSKVFSESRIVEYSIEENVISPGKREILIDNEQHYKFLGKDIDVTSLIKLYVVDGKVVRHEDWWNKKPFWNRETVELPLLGRAAEMARKGAMLATHMLMRFGKDPTA